MTYELLITLVSTALSAAGINIFQRFIEKKKVTKEENEIAEEVNKVYSKLEEDKGDVLKLMIRNVAELREYYVMNKQQARNSFSAALFICILGFLIFSFGLLIFYTRNDNASIIQYSTIGGSIVEIIAGLFFWLYSKAITQINIFHTSLQSTEKFLTAIQLVDKVSSSNRDDIYKDIISKIISFNFTALK